MENLEIFKREPKDFFSYNLYKKKYESRYNIYFFKFNFRKINIFFDLNSYDNFICYSFEILKQWIDKNEIYNEKYIYKLDKYINKLNLINILNTNENEYIIHIKSVVFSKHRNLKSLIVDFPLEKNEYFKVFAFETNLQNNLKRRITKNECVYFNFDLAFFLADSGNDILQGQAYISSYRIIFTTQFKIYSFYFDNIKDYKISNKGFCFVYFGKKYFIKTYDKYVFYVSFERMIYLK